MALQFTPIALGVMLVVAVGTFAYSMWNINSNRQSYSSSNRTNKNSFDYDCGYDTHGWIENSEEEQRKRKRKSPEPCTICLDAMKNNNLRTLPCKHTFHQHCIEVWLVSNKTCPICRKTSSSFA